MRLAPLALVLAAGCVLNPHSTSSTTDATPTSGTDSAGTTSAAATDPTTTSSSSTSSTSTTSTSGTTTGTTSCSLDCPGTTSGFPTFECDLWQQNCPEGQKCMPWANDGSSAWNATKCTDIMPNPGKPGDPCTVEGNGVSGVDSCEKAAMCFYISPDTGEGTCLPICTGTPDAPICPPGMNCVIASVLILCLPGCDPVAHDCPEMGLCIPEGDGFVCVVDNSGDMGQQNEPCESPSACDPGLVCADPALAAECDPMASGCCLPFCDLDNPECTNKGATCVPWYEPGMAPPLLDHVGLCRLPP